MSSMDRFSIIALTLLTSTALSASAPLAAQDAATWDRAKAEMMARAPTRMAQAIERWQFLSGTDRMAFDDYAGFVLAYPGFPQEEKLRRYAEESLDRDAVSAEHLVSFFDRNPPLTNSAKARYALALASQQRIEAFDVAREAWRGGEMSSPSEAYMMSMFGARFTPEDHDARMDALLWQGQKEAAARQTSYVSPAYRNMAMVRLAMLQDTDPATIGLTVPADASRDPGYVYNMVRELRATGQGARAVSLLANRPAFVRPSYNAEGFVGEMLRIARIGDSRSAQRIAASVDDLFAPGADISGMSYRLRDDYTSLMWLGGTKALWSLGDGNSAAPLFYRYGTAARTPQTRSKGFYWAGLASERAGNSAEANRYYEMAGEYADRFYGMLALEKLGRKLPDYSAQPNARPSQEERAAFNSAALTNAVREVSRGTPWRTGIQFYKTIAEQAETEAQHVLVAELAQETGRRDLAVNLFDAAGADGHKNFTAIGFPTLQTPPNSNWTMVHAISRQESQFAQNAISHAGARGLMQLMPGTAREQAGKLGMSYMSADLIDSPSYNIRLGDSYFARMMDYYGGAYPLAVAAYNAGPGNVNKWLRANGDPRTGSISYVDWIEQIPIYETKNYVSRVIENAVVYENMHPEKTTYGRPRTASEFLRR
ncbi:transglycosylase SLT domain-containing protein [Altererythrobacter confluentis]|uniref:Transglycosylase SLT domain-containing protein n=1 Tax=Allopontixanthobacter confluentis TaxID=1849021 RepID=A0A6L7GG25_9SPHN|nr:lytic transglycosylase domain-containing protein [Allopontixanthobacter confluentis]MXP14406.1 transglycosylase SLT domain-containing protein [Allopontixanthobacter confluentis]